MQVSTLSKEFVRIPVTAIVDGAIVDPTGDAVQVALVAVGAQPQSTDWQAGDWETAGTQHYARLLQNPGKAAGVYDVWLQITDSPEVIVRKAGQVTVY